MDFLPAWLETRGAPGRLPGYFTAALNETGFPGIGWSIVTEKFPSGPITDTKFKDNCWKPKASYSIKKVPSALICFYGYLSNIINGGRADNHLRGLEDSVCRAGLPFFSGVSISVPAAAFKLKRTLGYDFFGCFTALGTFNVLCIHADQSFGYGTLGAFKFINRHSVYIL